MGLPVSGSGHSAHADQQSVRQTRVRWLAALLLALGLAVPFFWALDAEEFHGDESHWISSGQQAFHFVREGRLTDPEWQEEFYFYSQPQVGKLIIGASLALNGHRGETRVFDYDWQLRLPENRAAGRVPAPGAISAGRIPGAFAGWIACLLLWLIARRLDLGPAGPLAATLLASHPLWLANARRAGLDTIALALGLAGAYCVVRAVAARRSVARTFCWWAGAGVLTGLAAGTKYVALLALSLGAIAVIARVFEARTRRAMRDGLAGSVAASTIAALVFVATNPALYPDPAGQLAISIGFLRDQANDMRRTLPEFHNPFWVAVEIVDRAVWPLGGPHVVEQSMPEPLIPGSYGTPVVAFGALVGIWLTFRGPPGRSAPLGVPDSRSAVRLIAAWTVLVFTLLALSVPTWWERWHLPLVPPLTLLAGVGLARMPRNAGALLAAGQSGAALMLLPSYLGRGFAALALTPPGLIVHAIAFAAAALTLVSQWRAKERRNRGCNSGGHRTLADGGRDAPPSRGDHRDGRDRQRTHSGVPEDGRCGAIRGV